MHHSIVRPGSPGLRGLLGLRSLSLSRVALERTRRRELAELMAYHVLRHVHRNELAAIVNCNGVADEVRVNRGPAGPSAQDLLVIDLIHSHNLLHEMTIDERAFFRGT